MKGSRLFWNMINPVKPFLWSTLSLLAPLVYHPSLMQYPPPHTPTHLRYLFMEATFIIEKANNITRSTFTRPIKISYSIFLSSMDCKRVSAICAFYRLISWHSISLNPFKPKIVIQYLTIDLEFQHIVCKSTRKPLNRHYSVVTNTTQIQHCSKKSILIVSIVSFSWQSPRCFMHRPNCNAVSQQSQLF